MDTALNRVMELLKNSDALYIHQIQREAQTTEREAKASIKVLNSMGQIEMIPTPGRWGARYAWLAANPVSSEPPAIPEEDLIAGEQETITGDGSGKAMPEIPLLTETSSPNRWAVAVPKRPLRVVKSRARAEALALAAVRRGAKGAEVFALTAVGRAKRDATFEVRL